MRIFTKSLLQKYYRLSINKSKNPTKINHYQAKIIQYSSYFNSKYYQKTYHITNNPSLHYLKSGYKKGFNPSPLFQTNLYLEAYPDVKNAKQNPLLHYELYGKFEGRQPQTLPIYQGNYHPYKIRRFISRHFFRIINLHKIIQNRNAKILVVLHLFYMNSAEEIIEYLKNLECYNYDLVISCIDNMYDQPSLDKIKHFKPSVQFVKYPNQGFDIGPFIDILNSTSLDQYDIIIKLQSKNTTKSLFVYQQIFRKRDWFINLFNGVLGAHSIHQTIHQLNQPTKYGLVAAKNLIVKDPPPKQALVHADSKIPVPKDYRFVAGSCFAIRAHCLQKIKNLNLTIKDFKPVKPGHFSEGHILERSICYTVQNQGYNFFGNPTALFQRAKYHKAEQKLQQLSALNLYHLKNITLDNLAAIRYLEVGMASDHKIINTKLSSLKPKRVTKNKHYYKIEQSLKDGYDNRHLIIIDQNNQTIDGNYRVNILKSSLPPDTKIKVLKIHFITPDLNQLKPFSDIKFI